MFWNKDRDDNSDEVELVLLQSTQDEYKFLTLKSILDNENIPYIVKSHGPGGYMRIIGGLSVYPTDILVEKSTYERAKKLLEDFFKE